MKRLLTVMILSCLAAVCAAPAPAQEGRKPVVAVEKLADGLWMLRGGGGNVVLCGGPDGLLFVDAQQGAYTRRLLEVADSLTGSRHVRLLVNTHYHGDHTGGDSLMAAAGAAIVAHDNVRRRMSVAQFSTTFSETIPAEPRQAWPIVTFGDSVTLHLNGRDLRVYHLPPGHTDGDAVVWIPSADVIHMGDTFFNGYYPVIDVSAGGGINGMIREVNLALRWIGPGTKIVPGHGPLADRAALLRYRDMLMTVRDRVTALVREGKTADEVMAAKPLADLDATWGQGFMKPDFFLKVVTGDLMRFKPVPRPRRR